ncbi:glycosyltransferase [Pantoea sp. JZ2]|uniref:glycosyltransferase family 2 protein n=1 Tax=Pantoea sp. JZ2 TaxID=2654189 RepID=UPI002B48B453|nr:glycosyltransferase family 2 protein [Pantoea sp. JZ2]WRH12761.1 glycosyltransferase [Pantoea sp. JZ2]
MQNVDIAMATYNGEKYIAEQLRSIQNQTYPYWTLYISDDASTDNTKKIIEEFASQDTRIKLINIERQGGVVNNFNKALLCTNAEFVLLSDQDDYWPEHRIKDLLDFIMQKPQDKVAMVFSDLTLVDENLKVISESFYKSRSIDPLKNSDYKTLIWQCSVYGCSVIMNRKLLDKCLPLPEGITMHDNWLALNAATEKGLFFYDHQTIFYRQHSNNVVGGSGKTLTTKIKSLPNTIDKIIKYRKKITKLIAETKKIRGNESLASVGNSWLSDVFFALRNITPEILFGSRRGYAFFMLIAFVVTR